MGGITEVTISKDMRHSGMPVTEIVSMAYLTALNAGDDSIRVTYHTGWKQTYSMRETRDFLRRSAWHRDLLHPGAMLGMDAVQQFRYRQQQFLKQRGLFVPLPT